MDGVVGRSKQTSTKIDLNNTILSTLEASTAAIYLKSNTYVTTRDWSITWFANMSIKP